MGRKVREYAADTPQACAAKSCIEVGTCLGMRLWSCTVQNEGFCVLAASDRYLDHFNVQNQQNLGKSPKYILTCYYTLLAE